MKKCKIAAATIASLSLLAFRYTNATAEVNSFTVSNSTTEPLSYTVKTNAEGTPVWVTIIPQGHTISDKTLKTQPWWNWGNTLSDTYLFAVGHQADVEMILQFQEQSNGVPEAHLYGDISGHKQIQYEWNKDKTQNDSTHTYSLKILSLSGVQTIDMTPTKGDSWVVNGHPNYDLRLESNMNLPDKPARIELVGSGGTDVPQWQTGQLTADPHPDWSYQRFSGLERMPDAPPYQVEKPFMPSFPYIGIHYGQPNWFTNNPNPLYFNTKTFQFIEEPIVGFQEGGIYQFNSVASPPHVDFESPFGFYNFNPKTRYAQLVVRAQNYVANDPYFYYPTSKELQTYRYSWSMGTTGVWTYGLTLGGFRSFPGSIRIGDTSIDGVAPTKLPQWTINHRWETITLDQAMNGYTGSEGIYFYSVQSPDMWRWMLGYLDQPPKYLEHPMLPNQVELDTQSTISVPLGFRDEYSSAYFHTPVLYASPIDHLMHLQWGSGGVYHFSKSEIIRTSNLDGGKYINSWTLETIPTKTKPFKVLEQIANLDGYLLYSGSRGVLIRKAKVSPSLITIQPPTDKVSWQSYVSEVTPYRRGNNPAQMYSWFRNIKGTTQQMRNASFQHLQADISGFSFELEIFDKHSELSHIGGLPTHPGKYMVNYHAASRQWSYTTAQAPKLIGSVAVVGADKMGQLSKYVMIIENQGTVPWTGTVTAFAGEMLMYQKQLTIRGGQTWHQTLGWTPENSGDYHIGVQAGHTLLFDHLKQVSNDTKLRYDFWFHPGTLANVVNGILVILLVALSLTTMRVLRRITRKEDLS